MPERPLFVDEGLMSSLTGREPEVVVDDMLRHLIRRYRAEGGAVFALQDESLHIYVARRLPDHRIAAVNGLLSQAMPTLLQRETVRAETEILAPLHTDDHLLGFLFLDFPEGGCHDNVDPRALSLLCGSLTRGLKADRCGQDVCFGLTHREIERLRVFRALEVCGDNKTAAAKMLGVTRRTVYYRLS